MTTFGNCTAPVLFTFPTTYIYTPPTDGRMAVIDSGSGPVYFVRVSVDNQGKPFCFWWRGSKQEIAERLRDFRRVELEQRGGVDREAEVYYGDVILGCPGG